MFSPGDIISGIESHKYIFMRAPSAPQRITWIIGLVAGLLGILGHFAEVPYLTEYHFILLMVGFIALALGTTFKQM